MSASQVTSNLRSIVRSSVRSKGRTRSNSRPRLREIDVPLALLLTKDLTPAAKLLWARLRFDELDARTRNSKRKRSHSPKRLAKRTSLARSTIYEALKSADATGWLVPDSDSKIGNRRWKTACPVHNDRYVKIPVDLIRSSHALRPQAILCYGLLQAMPRFNGITGEFKWAELSKLAGLHLKTAKRAVQALVDALWIAVVQKNRVAPIRFRLQHADHAYKESVRRYLEKGNFFGEGIMRSILSLVTDAEECHDDAEPDFLVNPATGEKLQLDRYCPIEKAAFEFNGPQHYRPTARYSKQEVAAQRKRDALKRKICKEKEVSLVVVHADDLSVTGILKKVGGLLPRKALRGFRETIRFLNECGRRCQLSFQRLCESS